MSGEWWVGRAELDEDQQRIIALPADDNALIMGPPGSGKTNLLLLRANYLYLAGLTNIAVVTFTRPLREFIASGSSQYDFPTSLVMTSREWQVDLIRQYGGKIPKSTGDFEADRASFLAETARIAEATGLNDTYQAILLDEAQDYTPEEIQLFNRLAERLFCVADDRQKIYEGHDPMMAIREATGEPHVLRYHYRNGLAICKVADEIAKGWAGHRPLAESSNYDETANESTVDTQVCSSLAEQASRIIERLGTQLDTFPGQLIGVLCPTNESADEIWDAIKASIHAASAFRLQGNREGFPEGKSVVVSTFHAAKGLEFRALHLAACDELKASFFRNNRRLTFTAVTRSKTSLSVYHCGGLYPYFDAALRSLEPAPAPPNVDDAFGAVK